MKMSEKCTDISQNITKLSYPGEHLGFTTEIDGRENKEDFFNFPFDHMYACSSDNSDVNSDRQAGESEVRHLKDLLLLHLDLIQQQSDEIVNKDKYIDQLRHENEQLKQRLDCMEHRGSSQQNNKINSHIHSENNFNFGSYSNNMTHDTGFCTDSEETKNNLKVVGLCSEETDYKPVILNHLERHSDCERDSQSSGDTMGPSDRCYSNRRNRTHLENEMTSSSTVSTTKHEDQVKLDPKLDIPNTYPDSTTISPHNLRNTHLNFQGNDLDTNLKETRQFALRPNSRRKRLCSSSSQLSNSESLASTPDERRKSERKRRKGSLKRLSILTTDTPYITQTSILNATVNDEQFESLDVNNSTNLEVPRWRIKLYTSCYSMEGTENLDDDVYNRRHMRLENDERRRKRWDVQRIREQRHIERLKQRQERQGSKSDEHSTEPMASFWPSLEDVRYIEVTDELPVSAFGIQLPKLIPSEFRLPWLNGTVSPKKPQTRKSTARRKSKR